MTGKVSSLERRWAWLAYGSSHRVLVEHAATLLSCSRDVPFILRMQESTALEISASGAQTRMPAHVGSRLRKRPGASASLAGGSCLGVHSQRSRVATGARCGQSFLLLRRS